MELDKEILKEYIDTIILSVLSESDMDGYGITKRIKEKSKSDFEINEVTFYVSLRRLEKKAYLEGYWNYNEGTEVVRTRYYRVTDSGKSFFSYRAEEWLLLKSLLNNFM